MSRRLLQPFSSLITSLRTVYHHKQHTPIHKRYRAPGGIKYPGGITYYPRNPDHEDPEYTPSKLFRVERIKPVKGTNRWHRKILTELHLDGVERVTIVKNIPTINARLWNIKHLIKVTPITFPYGEPTEDDIKHTVLKENGECLVIKKLAVDQKVIEASEQFVNDDKKMDNQTLRKDSRNKWTSGFSGGF